MWYVIKSISKYQWYISFAALICFLSPFVAILTSDALGILTEHFAHFGIQGSSWLLGTTILLFLIEAVLTYLFYFICGKIQAAVYSSIQNTSYHQIIQLPLDSFLMSETGDLYTRISNDANELTTFLSETVPSILMQTSQLFITITYLFLIDWKITLIYFIAVLCSVILQGIISRIMKKAGANVKIREVEMNSRLNDILNNRIVIKTYNVYDFVQSLCEKNAKEYENANIRLSKVTMPLTIVEILCGMIPILSICIAGLYLIPRGELELGVFMSIFYLCKKIVPKQLHYVDLLIAAVKSKPAILRMSELWKSKSLGNDTIQSTVTPGSITLSNVSYRYPGTTSWAVRHISLKISAGKKVAFIGESGCGKSTVLKLISGLILPQEGQIITDNPVLTSQFPHLFSDTVRQNVGYGKANSSTAFDAGFRKACEGAELSSFIDRLENGLDTPLRENGDNLSGGQRQRIAVARALYSQSPVLLFDESVSALDADTSQKLIRHIVQDTQSTVIMVLHQKELLSFFDEVYLFDEGELVRHGTFDSFYQEKAK